MKFLMRWDGGRGDGSVAVLRRTHSAREIYAGTVRPGPVPGQWIATFATHSGAGFHVVCDSFRAAVRELLRVKR